MSLFRYQKNRLGYLEEIRLKKGDFGTFKLGSRHLTLLAHPDDIQWVHVKNPKNYLKGTNLGLILGNGILTSEGELWRKNRKILQPLFHQSHLHSLLPIMSKTIQENLNGINGRNHISETVMKIAYEIVAHSLFGESLNPHFAELHEIMKFLNEFVTSRLHQVIRIPLSFPLPSHLKFQKTKARLHEIMDHLIAEKKSEIERNAGRKDLISLLISAKDDETGEKIELQQIRDEAITLLLAGHETTGHTLSWIIHLLSTRPEIQNKILDEIHVNLGKNPDFERIDPDQLSKLSYLTKVMDETMRLYPAVWAWTRIAAKDDLLNGKPVKAGSVFIISPYITHRHPEIWKNPNHFDPERFDGPLNDLQKGAFFPFGLGPRQCIGRFFALMEMKLVLIHLIQKHEIKSIGNASAEPYPRVTMGIQNGLEVMIRERT